MAGDPRYEVGLSKAGVNTANTIMWQFRAPSRRARIYELGIFCEVVPSTAPQFVLARSTAGGTSSTTTVGNAVDPNDGTATGTLDSAWSAAPTFSTTGPFLRRMTLPLTAGAGIIWTWPRQPLVVTTTATTSLTIANAVATGATLGQFSVYITFDE